MLHEQRFVGFDHDAGLLDGYAVAACEKCGFVYADGLPEPVVFERYYREMSKHEPDFDPAEVVPAYKRHNTELVALQVGRRLPDRTARILDVGVGSGETLVALRELGYTNLTGLDPSARTAEIVRRRHHLRMLNTPISELRSCDERFDVVLLSGVLEHLRDLGSTLVLLKTLLAPGGVMCIAVPDAMRFTECVDAPYQYISVEHINFFTLKSLQSLFAAAGMELHESWNATALLGVFREPIVHAVFGAASLALPVVPDRDGAEQMAHYLADCGRQQSVLVSSVHGLIESGEDIIVWGAGSLTMNLLSDPGFSQLNITAFVDANANYWDKTIRDVPVLSPFSLRDRSEAILVVSYSYEEEICREIRHRYRLENRVVRMFGRYQSNEARRREEVHHG